MSSLMVQREVVHIEALPANFKPFVCNPDLVAPFTMPASSAKALAAAKNQKYESNWVHEHYTPSYYRDEVSVAHRACLVCHADLEKTPPTKEELLKVIKLGRNPSISGDFTVPSRSPHIMFHRFQNLRFAGGMPRQEQLFRNGESCGAFPP